MHLFHRKKVAFFGVSDVFGAGRIGQKRHVITSIENWGSWALNTETLTAVIILFWSPVDLVRGITLVSQSHQRD